MADTRADPTFRRITPKKVSDRVAEEILRLIAGGALVPGQRLPGERQLAAEMGVSRVSVRAALQKLKTKGFLEAVQGGGTRIISSAGEMDRPLTELLRVNRENLHDLAEIRAILEVWAARRAAENAAPEHIAEMDRLLDAMEDERRASRHKAADDVRFHLAIARASGSAVYAHILAVIRDILTPMLEFHRYELFSTLEDDRRVNEQHRVIVEAIRARDPDRAAFAMHRHLSWVLSHYAAERERQEAAGRTGSAVAETPVAPPAAGGAKVAG